MESKKRPKCSIVASAGSVGIRSGCRRGRFCDSTSDWITFGSIRLCPDVVPGEIPLHQTALAHRFVAHVRSGRRAMAGHRIFPIRLAGADGIEEVAEVQHRGLGRICGNALRLPTRTLL